MSVSPKIASYSFNWNIEHVYYFHGNRCKLKVHIKMTREPRNKSWTKKVTIFHWYTATVVIMKGKVQCFSMLFLFSMFLHVIPIFNVSPCYSYFQCFSMLFLFSMFLHVILIFNVSPCYSYFQCFSMLFLFCVPQCGIGFVFHCIPHFIEDMHWFGQMHQISTTFNIHMTQSHSVISKCPI